MTRPPIRYDARTAGESSGPRAGDPARTRATALDALARAVTASAASERMAAQAADAGDMRAAAGHHADALAALHPYPAILREVYPA